MAGETRQRMIEGAARLLAEKGLQETSFASVLDATGAPRGSIYHHFPDGKGQLVTAAVDLAGARAIHLMLSADGASATDITSRFLGLWREVLTRSEFRAGCSVLAVTVATDSPELLGHTAGVFRRWRESLAALLVTGGLSPDDAAGFAALLIASSEGAVVMSRAEASLAPFEAVVSQLLDHVGRLSKAG